MNSDVLLLHDEPQAASVARRFVADRLSRWGWPQVVDDAELCTSELVTNAMLHARSDARLLVQAGTDGVRVEVHDGSRQVPTRGSARAAAMTGRGLLLIEAVASAWGVEPDAHGKSVWFELSVMPAGVGREPTVDELLGAWDVDDEAWGEPAESGSPCYHVTVSDVPVGLLADTAEHVDNLVREFTLAGGVTTDRASVVSTDRSTSVVSAERFTRVVPSDRVTGPPPDRAGGVPAALSDLVQRVVSRYDAQRAIRAQAQQALARGADRLQLELELPLGAVADGAEFVDVLDEADEYCRAARLLTLESSPQFRVFRRWYVDQIGAALRAAASGEEPVRQSFEARLLEELAATAAARRVAERSSRIQRLTAALAGALTWEKVASAVLQEGIPALDARAASLVVPAPEGGLYIVGSIGHDEELLQRLAGEEVTEMPVGVALQTREPVWLESPEERDSRFPGLVGVDADSISLCAVPLLVEGRPLGVLRFSFSESRLFGAEERSFVQALAAQTAQALDRARLYAEEHAARQAAEAAADRLARLYALGRRWSTTVGGRVSGDVTTSDDATASGRAVATDRRRSPGRAGPSMEWASLAYSAVLDELTDAVVVADAEGTIRYVNRATERLLGAGPNELTAVALVELVPDRLRAAHLAGVARFLSSRRPQLMGTPMRVPALRRDGTEVDVELRLSAVPLGRSSDGVVADLLLVGTLRDIGDQVQLERRVAAEEELRRVASSLQRSLLPRELPQVPGVALAARYRGGTADLEVGGDFYDVFRAGDGSWAVVLGDVCGKGVEAAAVTALARHTARAAAQQTAEPTAVLQALNAALTADADRPFVTACYLRLLAAPGRVTGSLVCAGHPLPLLLSAAGNVTAAGSPGSLLGVLTAPELTAVPVELSPGDSLVLYTDGVTEGRTRSGQRLGEPGLVACLAEAAGGTADQIAAAVFELINDDTPTDDIAVLVLAVPPATPARS